MAETDEFSVMFFNFFDPRPVKVTVVGGTIYDFGSPNKRGIRTLKIFEAGDMSGDPETQKVKIAHTVHHNFPMFLQKNLKSDLNPTPLVVEIKTKE